MVSTFSEQLRDQPALREDSMGGCQDPKPLPVFPLSNADMTLCSLEGTSYGVHSHILRDTCGLFATMFTLPSPKAYESLCIYESDAVLQTILYLLSGHHRSSWDSLDQAESVLIVAEKWDAPVVIERIRPTLFTPRFCDADPLRLYAIARHFDWDREARALSLHILALDLRDPIHQNTLASISSKHLKPLFDLRRSRKETLEKMLNSTERFIVGNSTEFYCIRCGCMIAADETTWHTYKKLLLVEFERRPLGDTLGVLSGGLSDCPEARACWEAKCSRCSGFKYDRDTTLRQIQNCISILSAKIEENT